MDRNPIQPFAYEMVWFGVGGLAVAMDIRLAVGIIATVTFVSAAVTIAKELTTNDGD